MQIEQIYKKYKIMPNLRLHQYRVASVGRLISANMEMRIDIEAVTTALLLHDMGNIIKFKLGMFPEFLEPEGLGYWTGVQNEYFEKYGKDEHDATLSIAKEIGVKERVYELIESVGFSNSEKNYNSDDFEKKICAYSDQRVMPNGISSLEDRMLEGRKRYAYDKGKKSELFIKYSNFLTEIEKQIFSHCLKKPNEVNNESVEKIIPNLSLFEIKS